MGARDYTPRRIPETGELEPWHKYQVTDADRIEFKNLVDVDYIVTAQTMNGANQLVCYVTRKDVGRE